MKKLLLFTGILTVLASAGSLWANTDWYGKFWGDLEGEWKGTICDTQDPPYFKGVWTDGQQEGTLYADLEYAGHWVYKIVKGVIYDSEGNHIGYWDGYFDANIKPGYAEGKWWLVDVDAKGYWQGQRSW